MPQATVHLIDRIEDLAVPSAVYETYLRELLSCPEARHRCIRPPILMPCYADLCRDLSIDRLVHRIYGEDLHGVRLIPWQLTAQAPVRYRFLERQGAAVVKVGEVFAEQDPLQAAFDRFCGEMHRHLEDWADHPLVHRHLGGLPLAIDATLMRDLLVGWYAERVKPRLAPGIRLPDATALAAICDTHLVPPFSFMLAYGQGSIRLGQVGDGFQVTEEDERGYPIFDRTFTGCREAQMATLGRLIPGTAG